MSKEHPTLGEEFTISLQDYWWANNGDRIISGTETMDMQYGYIEASYNTDPDLSNGDGYFDFYDPDGNLCIMNGETAVVIEILYNGDMELQGPENDLGTDTTFMLTSEEFDICAF